MIIMIVFFVLNMGLPCSTNHNRSNNRSIKLAVPDVSCGMKKCYSD